jgi:hypothetical protein
MLRRRTHVLTALAALVVTLGSPMAKAGNDAASGEPIDAIWRQHRVNFDFQSFNVRYSCEGLQTKLSRLLMAMGAHRDVAVEMNCPSSGLVASARFMVTLKLPVIASEENVRTATTYSTEQQLVARLHSAQLPSANDLPHFNAEWRTVTLTRDRGLRLDSGDCDLLLGVRDQLLPQLGISLADSGFHCYGGGTRTRPVFRVSALLPVQPTPVPVALAAQPGDVTVD